MASQRKAMIGTAAASVALGYLLGGKDPDRLPETDGEPRTVSALTGSRAAKPERAKEFDVVWRGKNASENIFLATTLANIRDPAKIRDLLEQTDLLPANVSQGSARGILLRNWLEIDPHAAAIWATHNAGRHLPTLLETWVANDFEAARAAVLDAPSDYASRLGAAVLESLANESSEEALAYLFEVGPQLGSISHYGEKAFRKLATEDPRAFLDFAETVPSQMRSGLREAAAWAMAQSDPVSATTWWKTQPDRDKLVEPLFRDATPASWGTIIAQLSEQESRTSHHFHSVYYRWAARDRTAFISTVATWLPKAEDKHSMLSSIFGSQVKYWIRSDREAAKAWATTLTDEGLQKQVAGYLEKAEEDDERPPPATTAAEVFDGRSFDYYAITRLSLEERRKLPEELAAQPPARAAQALSQFLGNNDTLTTDEIPALFAAVPVSEENQSQLENALESFMDFSDLSPAETARWAEQLPPGPLLETAISNATTSWERYDPGAARAWAESLSDPDARARALSALGNSP